MSDAATAYRSTFDSRSAPTRRNERRRRTSGRAYNPEVPEKRHGIPARFRARRIGSAWPFARTRTAWSRAAAPASIRRPTSAAIQSASSEPVAKTSSRTGLAAREARGGGAARGAERFPEAGAPRGGVGVVKRGEPIRRVEDRRERAVVPTQDDG